MRKVLKSLPSIRQTLVALLVFLGIGVLVSGGFHPKALVFLGIGFIYLAFVTMRNYNPDAWEAYHDPVAHSLRHQRDDAVEQLRKFLEVADSGGPIDVLREARRVRQYLDEHYPSAPAR